MSSQKSGSERHSLAKIRAAGLTIAFWIFFVHAVGIYTFSRGFLLTRPVLSDQSQTPSLSDPQFKRAVVLVVDALRYDFVAPSERRTHYENHFPVLDSTAPDRNFLVKFVADPPTTTLQRLKGLTTGSLPAFIDAGSNFAGTKIEEDNWVSQVARLSCDTEATDVNTSAACGNVAFVGDDTWEALFGEEFSEKHPYPSLNVRDLDTVDNGVKHWLPSLISNSSNSLIIGHMLGVDHVGHRYGPNHPEMALKLRETADFIKIIAGGLDEDTVLFVFGDHGMDSTGNHGGDSPDEVDAALWVFTNRKNSFSADGPQEVAQIDLVPTLCGLLGLPIPFNSLGFPIRQAFNELSSWEAIQWEAAKQISRYVARVDNGFPLMDDVNETPQEYQKLILGMFRSTWVEFDTSKMSCGVWLLVLSMLCLFLLYNCITIETAVPLMKTMSVGALAGVLACYAIFQRDSNYSTVLAASALGVESFMVGYAVRSVRVWSSWARIRPSPWTLIASIAVILESATSFSNSFVIWESKVVHFILATLVILLGIRIMNGNPIVLHLGAYYCGAILVLLRLSSMWVVCREENGQWCRTTFYEPGSSQVATWTTFAVSIATLVLPWFVRRFWAIGGNDCKGASLVLSMTSLVLLLSVAYWAIDNAETRSYINEVWGIDNLKLGLSRFALLSSLLGLAIWWKSDLSISMVMLRDDISAQPKPKIEGYNNLYGSDAILPTLMVVWALAAVNKPPAILSIFALLYSSLSVLDLVDLSEVKYTIIVPVIYDAMGQLYFYWTGHQATIPSIQWDTAFVASKSVSYLWSPLTVTLNTIGPYILTSMFAVVSATWRRSLFRDPRQLMTYIIRACAGISLVVSVRTFASMVAALLLRRHLMTWKIFAPRFMLAAITLLSVDLGMIIATLFSSHSIVKAAKVFG